MRKKINYLLLVFGITILPVRCFCEATVSDGFLSLGAGARGISMGNAFTGLANDASAVYWNPAGVAQIPSSEVLAMYDTLYEGISYVYFAYCMKSGEDAKDAIGWHLSYLGSGDMLKSDIDGNEEGSFTVSDVATGITYSRMMNENVYLGGNLKAIRKPIADYKGMGYAVDGGLLYKGGGDFSLGVVLQNFGTGVKLLNENTAFPETFRTGIGYGIFFGGENPLYLTSDVSYILNEGTFGMGIGAEFTQSIMSFRVGAEKTSAGVLPGVGIGISQKIISVDIGMAMHEQLGATFKVSVTGYIK